MIDPKQPYSDKLSDTDHIPVWEQVLRRLSHSAMDSEFISRSLLELYTQVADPKWSLERLLKKLPATVGSIIPETVVAVTTGNRDQLISSNIGRVAEQEVLNYLKNLSSEEAFNGRVLKKTLKLGRVSYVQVYTSSLSNVPGELSSLYLFTAKPLLAEQVGVLGLTCRLVRLKANLHQQTNRLSQEQERFVGITHQLSEGMAILDRDLQVTTWNRPLQQITGFASSAAIGRPYQSSLYRIDNPDWLQTVATDQQLQNHRNIFSAEFQIQTKTKQAKWVSLSGSFLRNSANQIEQVIIIVRDISHSKELERRKSEFTSIATHELRTPITAISGYLSLINHNASQLSEKHQLYLERATQASQRLVRLAEDLLRVTQLEENRTQFNRQPVKIVALIEKLVVDFSEKAKLKNINLSVEKSDEQTINVDPDRLSQALANLIDNALKYTEKGKVTFTVRNKTNAQVGEVVIITLKDTGRGISAKEQEVIFDKFRRGTSANLSRESGAGLGLFIVKSFIEKQGGTITLRSRPNYGSVFQVTFPASLANVPSGKFGLSSSKRKKQLYNDANE